MARLSRSWSRRPIVFFLIFLALALAFAGKGLVVAYKKIPIQRGPLNTYYPLVSETGKAPSLRFFALGDSGTGEADQFAVAAAMERRCLELGGSVQAILLLGDNFYVEGVSSTEDPQWEDKLLGPYGSPCLKNLPIQAILGNHDYKGNAQAQVDYSLKKPRWKMPHRFYSVEYGDLLKIVSIDALYFAPCGSAEFCSHDFAKKALTESPANWKIVLSHYPLQSSNRAGYGYTGNSLFGHFSHWSLCGDYDMWLSGHTHHMEYRDDSACKAALMISGGGGQNLATNLKPAEGPSQFVASSFGFLDLDVQSSELAFHFIDQNSKVLYSKRLKK
ncbi:MAG: metallophosphoesterase [Oligoflexales bacterium]|nr:metallophosphoesterase [Oligoflexales bacterium]